MKKELTKKQRQSCSGGIRHGHAIYRKTKVDTAVKKKGALEDAIANTQNLLKNLRELKLAYMNAETWQ